MKLSFRAKDGTAVTVEAEDGDLVLAEIRNGADQDFVMLRFKPGTMKVSTPADAHSWRFSGAGG